MRYAAVLVILLVSLTGCGGSDSESDLPATSVTTAADNGATTTSQTPTTTSQSPATTAGSSDNSPIDCPELMSWANDSIAAINPAFGGGGTSTDGVQFTADFFQEFADRAPSEIRDDMQVFADAYEGFYSAIEALDFDFFDPTAVADMDAADMAQLNAAIGSMDTPEVDQALDNIEAFFDRECP